MNKQDLNMLLILSNKKRTNQREVAKDSGHSLGFVNKHLKNLMNQGYITETLEITKKAKNLLAENKPKNAIILAAGFGMRMVPINFESPKALLEVNGERIIERQIRQLHDAGISEIHVVVGFMKEKFEYLIDKFGVDLIVNPEYSTKNNLYSLNVAKDYLDNTYVIPSDVWCGKNPFKRNELFSWYMVSDLIDDNSNVRVNRKNELVITNNSGNTMIGISYLSHKDCDVIKKRLAKYCTDHTYDDDFWEICLYGDKKMFVSANVVNSMNVAEINTYEQLRDLDADSDQLNSDIIKIASTVLGCDTNDINNIEVLKKGMTNRSFLFKALGQKYIMRIPGEGTDQLIDRKNEADVYRAISGRGLCDDPIYINRNNGYKITKFLENVRACDPNNENDVKKCIEVLKKFHSMKLKVNHSFDIYGQIDFYESLWNGSESMYPDYKETKENIFKLKRFIEEEPKIMCLTHIDAVPDNFLFYSDDNGEEKVQLTDWEYAGMQDPHVDIAMFCIYSLYDKKQIDKFIDIYFNNECSNNLRCKIYCYISICGLLWSNWCEYKSQFGVEFGEYSLRQYRYAKEYYRFATKLMKLKKV